jgi:hypothetical protein
MKYFLLLVFIFQVSLVHAQKKTYYLYVFGQKKIGFTCGMGEEFFKGPVELTQVEAQGIVKREEGKYRDSKGVGYKNIYAVLIRPGQVGIFYTARLVFKNDCTSTFYGLEVGDNLASAQAKLAALRKIWSKTEISEVATYANEGKPLPEKNKAIDYAGVEARYELGRDKEKHTGVWIYLKNTNKAGSAQFTVLTKSGSQLSSIALKAGEKNSVFVRDENSFDVRIVFSGETPNISDAVIYEADGVIRHSYPQN